MRASGAKERTIQGYAMMHGLKLDRIYVGRAVSGSRPIAERPEGGKLLAAAGAGDVVIMPKLDRMFRSALDALEVLARLKDRGVRSDSASRGPRMHQPTRGGPPRKVRTL